MRLNVAKVLEAFTLKKPARGDSNGTVSTDGTTFYSYSTPLAHWNEDGTITMTLEGVRMSATTKSHIRAFESVFLCTEHSDCIMHANLARACKEGRKS